MSDDCALLSNFICIIHTVSVSDTAAIHVTPVASAPSYVTGSTLPTAPGYAESLPVVTAVADPEIGVNIGKRSAAERMRELEEMKNLLTEEEYERKRAEILSDV